MKNTFRETLDSLFFLLHSQPRGTQLSTIKSVLFQLSITLFLLCAYTFSGQAQSNLNDDGGTYTISANGTYQDFKVPSNTTETFITFTLVGADGGSGTPNSCDKVPGGAGAEITAIFRIGNEAGQIPKGSTIRFIPGEGGPDVTTGSGTLVYSAAGGGGGTGLLIKKGSNWEILAVAGGGGGAFVGKNSFGVCRKDPGNSAQTGPNGGQGDNDGAGTPGTNGNGARAAGTDSSNGGGGAFSDALASNGVLFTTSGRKGMTTGGVPDLGQGGYGFGSGGSASNINYRGGGGGGYSGGAEGGDKGSGGGGGSFVSPDAVAYRKTVPERTTQVNDGKIEYQFYSACEVKINQVREILSYACLNLEGGGNVATGATLQTDASITGECSETLVQYRLYELLGSAGNVPALRRFNFTGLFENVPPGKWRVEGIVLGGTLPSSDRYDIEILEEDPTPTRAKCVDAVTVDLGNDGQGTISVNDLNDGSTGKCGVKSLEIALTSLPSATTYSTISYDCNDVGFGVIYLKVTDNFGNTDACSVNIYIEDTVNPKWTAIGNVKATVYLDDNGEGIVTEDDIVDIEKFVDDCSSTDQLSFIFSGDNAFNCNDVGENVAALEVVVSDLSGNSSSYALDVTVVERNSIVARCQDVVVQLDVNGEATISIADIDQGSSDGCNIPSLSLNVTSFDCENVGDNTVLLTATNEDGSTSSCTANVKVKDLIAPTAVCSDGSILDQSHLLRAGTTNQGFEILGQSFTAGLTGPLKKVRIYLSGNADGGTIDPTIEIREGEGLNGIVISSVEAIPILSDQNTPGQWWEITFLEPAQVTADNKYTIVTAANSSILIQSVGLNARRKFGNPYPNGKMFFPNGSIAEADILFATFIAMPITVQLNAAGVGSLSVDDIDAGSTDVCGIASLSLDQTSFDCTHLGDNTVTLTVVDNNSNSSICQATVSVQDEIAPVADCFDFTIQLRGGIANYAVYKSQIFQTVSDNCEVSSIAFLNDTKLTCEDIGINEHAIEMFDASGNRGTCSFLVTVVDEQSPSAVCQDLTIALDDTGNGSISPAQIDNGSSDYCSGLSLALDQSQFDCSDIGSNNIVTLTVTDDYGNASNCEATVTVIDETAPIASCQDVIIDLAADETATLTADLMASSSTDNCGGLSFSIESGMQAFDCSHVGQSFEVFIKVEDASANASSCSAMVRVADPNSYCNEAPTAVCQNITVDADEHCQQSIGAEEVDGGSSDLDGDELIFSLDQTGPFDLGNHILTLSVSDGLATSTCTATVTVEDNTGPTAICQDLTINLDENGFIGIEIEQVGPESYDNCSEVQLGLGSLSQTIFTCEDLGANIVTMTISDAAGNTSDCEATITVIDMIAPSLTCPSDMTVNTDAGECGAYITWPKAAPADNCGIKNLKSRYRTVDEQGDPVGNWSAWASDHSGFFELDSYQVEWRATDDSNNTGFCSFQLDIIDEEAPEVICKDVTINFNGEETIAIAFSSILDEAASFDACGAVSFVSQSLSEVSCENVGEALNIQVVGVDANSNTSSCTAQVSVVGLPCGFEATDIDCAQGAAAEYDPEEDVFTLGADDCSGYPQGEFSFVGTELCGDGEITVRVSGLVGDGRAGVVMMESTDSGSRRVSMLKSQTRQVTTEYRASTNGYLRQKHKNRSGVEWVKIVRIGNKFKTYTSTNGSYWKLAHVINYSNFADCIYAGIMVYSRRSYDPVTATFDELSITPYSNTAREALPTGTSVALEQTSEQSRLDDFQGNSLNLAVAPNPFSDQTHIEFNLRTAAEVTLEIYNLHGQRVHSLENAQLDAGTHRYQWNGNSSKGESLPTGIYMLRLRADKKWITTKVSLVNR